MSMLKQLRFRLGSARHAHRLHQEIASLRRERDVLLLKESAPKNVTDASSAGEIGTRDDVHIGDETRVGEAEAALGYGIPAHYRQRVGKRDWYDQLAALQVSLLFAAGLRDDHRLADVGCGSLRAGRMLIPYLKPGRYFGVEPEKWLVEEGLQAELGKEILKVKRPSFRFVADFSVGGFGTQFDYVLSQSVFSHTYPELTKLGFSNIAESLAPSGKLLATFREADPGDRGPKVNSAGEVFPNGWVRGGGFRYYWEDIEAYLKESGLVGRRLAWPHPTQSWFAACKPDSEAEESIERLSKELRTPRPQWGTLRKGRNRYIRWQ